MNEELTVVILLGLMVLGLESSRTFSQAKYPNKPVKLLFRYDPATASDISARILTGRLRVEFGLTG